MSDFNTDGLFEDFPEPADAVRIVELVIRDLRRNAGALRAAVAAVDDNGAARAAHAIAGVAANVAAGDVSAMARQLEVLIRTEGLTSALEGADQLDARTVQLAAALDDWRDARTGDGPMTVPRPVAADVRTH